MSENIIFTLLIFYSLFLPLFISEIILLSFLLLLDMNFSIYYFHIYSTFTIKTIIFYTLLGGKSESLLYKNNYNKYLIKYIILYLPIIVISLILLKFLMSEFLFKSTYNLILGFIFLIIFYIHTLSFKFNSIKETFKNLSINFYKFLIATSVLFAFKFYLLLSDIKTPSFYYLFLTIPISVVIIYFYTKDLEPIIKEYKNITPDSTN